MSKPSHGTKPPQPIYRNLAMIAKERDCSRQGIENSQLKQKLSID